MREIYTSLESVECDGSELKKFIILAACENAASIELIPDDGHKSFYGKAIIKPFNEQFANWYDDDVSLCGELLFSYNTPIIAKVTINDIYSALVPLYFGGYHSRLGFWSTNYDIYKYDVSPTTLRHIKAFCGLNKVQYYKLAVDFWHGYFGKVGIPFFGEQFTVIE